MPFLLTPGTLRSKDTLILTPGKLHSLSPPHPPGQWISPDQGDGKLVRKLYPSPEPMGPQHPADTGRRVLGLHEAAAIVQRAFRSYLR